MTWTVFVEDGTPGCYRAVKTIQASSFLFVQRKVRREYRGPTWNGRRLLALPDERRDLWPKDGTGEVDKVTVTAYQV